MADRDARRRNGHARHRGHGRPERMSKFLRDAFKHADEGAHLPLPNRLVGCGIPEGEMQQFLRATYDSANLTAALDTATRLLDAASKDDPTEPDELRAETAKMRSLCQLIAEEGEQEAMSNALYVAVHAGMLEGIVLGYVIAAFQVEARRNAMNQRPRR